MVHTAKLYIILRHEEKYMIERKYKSSITLIGTKLNEIYKGMVITFTKRYNQWFMFLTVDFIKLLEKCDITERDYKEVEYKINTFIYNIFGNLNNELILIRLDYRLDIKVKNEEERKLLMHLYKKTQDKYRFKKKYDKYKSTIYFNSKSVQSTVYDKEEERDAKNQDVENYEEDVLRFEVRLQNRHLNYMKYAHKIQKTLENYFNHKLYSKYMEENLGLLLCKGNYFRMYKCEKIIGNSELSVKNKKELRDFLIIISKKGMEIAKSNYSRYKFKKFIKQLEKLNINPIIIPKNYKIKLQEGYMLNPFYN